MEPIWFHVKEPRNRFCSIGSQVPRFQLQFAPFLKPLRSRSLYVGHFFLHTLAQFAFCVSSYRLISFLFDGSSIGLRLFLPRGKGKGSKRSWRQYFVSFDIGCGKRRENKLVIICSYTLQYHCFHSHFLAYCLPDIFSFNFLKLKFLIFKL